MAVQKVRIQKSDIRSKKKKTIESSSSDSPKSGVRNPTTMEELLKVTGYTLLGLKKGSVIEGKVARVSPKEITIDIGRKTEGVVIDKELETYKDVLMNLKVGDPVVCQVIVEENDRGQPVLSLRRNIFEKIWTDLTALQKSGKPVSIILKEPVRGGILAEYNGLRGYIPQSQLDSTITKQMDKVTGRLVQAKVMEVDKASNRLVFSQRAIAEAEVLSKQKDVLAAVPVGEMVDTVISSVVPFGAFAKFSISKDGITHEVEGLIHVSEIAWEKVDDPNEYLKVGDKVKVKVIGVDVETGKLSLSVKQTLPDPWEHVLDMFEKDSNVKGTVTKVTPLGVFVMLTPGVEGLMHASKITPGQEPKEGEEITVIVEDVKPDARKISLSPALKEKPIGYR
ncbi:S1 RNA-binding domain-containing protein [Candidatus Gottesmanbacteria bacterium]|nr:S1 RNA-binding domain-containing protein [Candidatus Gottesmanbacteria bacterium]